VKGDSLQQGRPDKGSFTVNVDDVVVGGSPRNPDVANPGTGHERGLSPILSRAIEGAREVRVGKRSEGDVDSSFSQVRSPLFDAIPLARGGFERVGDESQDAKRTSGHRSSTLR
jgi:hypothetical protein